MATESPKTRTLTGYMVFAMEQRSTVEKDQPTLKFAEISVELGKRWKALSDEQKAAYNTKGKETVIQVKPKKAKKSKAEVAVPTPVVATPVAEPAKKGKGKKAKAEVVVATPAVVVAETAKPTKGKKGKAAKATESVSETTTATPAVEKPKRGKNAFMYFLDEHRASVKAQLTEAKQSAGVTDVTKKVSEMWKVLSDADKAPFVEKSKNKA